MLIIKAKHNMPREEMKKMYRNLLEQKELGLIFMDDSYEIEVVEPSWKWIPVSERLPEDRDWYLAVFKEKDTGYQLIPRVADYIGGDNNWRMIDEEAFSKEYLDSLECVAWSPLPEPYKEEP